MAICLDFPITPPPSFFVFVLFVVVFVMHACRNRFIHLHAKVIRFPVLTAHFYLLFLISTFYVQIPLEKLSNTFTFYICSDTCGCDHELIFCVRLARNTKNNVRYVNDVVQLLSAKITAALDKTAPIKTFQAQTKYAPWLYKERENLNARRNKAHKIAFSTRRSGDRYCQNPNSTNNSIELN
jgi:hypothetical protein